MHNLSKYKCAIFDCDGVILQSNELKTNAFADALKGEPKELIEQFILYHKSNGGVSRYVKFEYYFRNLKGEVNYETMADQAISRYAKIVAEKLKTVDYVSGVISTIEFFNDKDIPCFVVSGGDEEELHDVFRYRGIFKKFVKILGSPVTKNEHIAALVQSNQLDWPAIFFGDARSDMDAALHNGLDFCFINQFSEWSFGKTSTEEFSCMNIRNFNELIL